MLLYVSPPVGTGNSSQPQPETLYLFPDPVTDGLSALFIRFKLLICIRISTTNNMYILYRFFVKSLKAFINAIDGNSFYNADENEQLRFEANYFSEGTPIDLDTALSSASSNLKVEWFIKSQVG